MLAVSHALMMWELVPDRVIMVKSGNPHGNLYQTWSTWSNQATQQWELVPDRVVMVNSTVVTFFQHKVNEPNY